MNKLNEYRKGVAAFLMGLGGFLTVALPVLTDGSVTPQDIVLTTFALAAWIGGTAAVVTVKNDPYTGK